MIRERLDQFLAGFRAGVRPKSFGGPSPESRKLFPRERRECLENLLIKVNSVVGDEFSHYSIEALDALLQEMLLGKENSRLIILEGQHQEPLKSKVEIKPGGYRYFPAAAFNKELHLRIREENLEKIMHPNTEITLTYIIREPNHLAVIGHLGEKIIASGGNKDGFLSGDCNEEWRVGNTEPLLSYHGLPKIIFKNYRGVGIRRVNVHGEMVIGGKPHYFGSSSGENYFFVFFNQGKVYFFDETGQQVKEAERPRQYNKKALYQKISQRNQNIEKAANRIDLEDLSTRAEKYLIELWKRSPEFFEKTGTRLYVRGETDCRVGIHGGCEFRHYREQEDHSLKHCLRFFVSKKRTRKLVNVYWEGENVLLLDSNGNTLNSVRLLSPGIITKKPLKVDKLLEAVVIENIKGGKYTSSRFHADEGYRLSINARVYLLRPDHFNPEEIPLSNPLAFFAHIDSEKEDSFRILLYDGMEIKSYPLICTHSWLKKKRESPLHDFPEKEQSREEARPAIRCSSTD